MPIKPWKTISTKVIHETPWIIIKEDLCQTDGKTITYTYTQRKDEGPFIIAEEADGKLWLVKQYRHPIKKVIWQFPGEGKKPGEAWVDTVQRGLQEEIGKQAKTVIQLAESHPDPGSLEQTTRFFLAKELYDVDKEHEAEGEVEELETKAFSLNDIETLIREGSICDNWTLSGLYLYRRFLSK